MKTYIDVLNRTIAIGFSNMMRGISNIRGRAWWFYRRG
jgi:hypothetical protein